MAMYIVHFEHYSNDAISAAVPVPYAVDPKDAADEYEIIVTTAYGALDAGNITGMDALNVQVDDLVATKITHGEDLIVSFE